MSRLQQETANFKILSFKGAKLQHFKDLILQGEIEDAQFTIIAVGTNNLQSLSPIKLTETLILIVQLFQAKFREKLIFVATLLPRKDHFDLDNKVQIVNVRLKYKAPKIQIGIFDIGKSFLHKQKSLDASFYHTDGLHLSDKGLRRYQQCLNNFVYEVKSKALNTI